jgi:hypothetical protein
MWLKWIEGGEYRSSKLWIDSGRSKTPNWGCFFANEISYSNLSPRHFRLNGKLEERKVT